jgi:hypothetical protein
MFNEPIRSSKGRKRPMRNIDTIIGAPEEVSQNQPLRNAVQLGF